MREYIASTAPGKTWAVSFYKPERGAAYVSAIEGERYSDEFGSGFRTVIGLGAEGDRRVKVYVQSPCTAKRKALAREALLTEMRAKGLIAEVDHA